MPINEKPDEELNTSIKLYFHDRLIYRFFAHFIPVWITPNYITVSRFILTPFVFYCIIKGYLKLGIFLFVIAAFTDVLDGVTARMRKSITKWGSVYDPVSDKLLIGGVMLILLVRHTNIYLSSIIIGLELVYIIAGFALKSHGIIKPANVWGKTKMVLQCIGIFFILLGLLINNPLANELGQWSLGTSIGFALMSLYKHGFGL